MVVANYLRGIGGLYNVFHRTRVLAFLSFHSKTGPDNGLIAAAPGAGKESEMNPDLLKSVNTVGHLERPRSWEMSFAWLGSVENRLHFHG